jgi:hypothetical protein
MAPPGPGDLTFSDVGSTNRREAWETVPSRERRSSASLRGRIADRPATIGQRGAARVRDEARLLAARRRVALLPALLADEATRAVGFALGIRFGRPVAPRRTGPMAYA